jgi:hypothetical protein
MDYFKYSYQIGHRQIPEAGVYSRTKGIYREIIREDGSKYRLVTLDDLKPDELFDIAVNYVKKALPHWRIHKPSSWKDVGPHVSIKKAPRYIKDGDHVDVEIRELAHEITKGNHWVFFMTVLPPGFETDCENHLTIGQEKTKKI